MKVKVSRGVNNSSLVQLCHHEMKQREKEKRLKGYGKGHMGCFKKACFRCWLISII